MKSRTTRKFWRLFEDLPDDIQEHVRRTYEQWRRDPAYPSVQFKRVSASEPIYSVRIGIAYRALGRLDGDTVTWFWIGSHDEYDRMLA
jgi:hypothetical protein